MQAIRQAFGGEENESFCQNGFPKAIVNFMRSNALLFTNAYIGNLDYCYNWQRKKGTKTPKLNNSKGFWLFKSSKADSQGTATLNVKAPQSSGSFAVSGFIVDPSAKLSLLHSESINVTEIATSTQSTKKPQKQNNLKTTTLPPFLDATTSAKVTQPRIINQQPTTKYTTQSSIHAPVFAQDLGTNIIGVNVDAGKEFWLNCETKYNHESETIQWFILKKGNEFWDSLPNNNKKSFKKQISFDSEGLYACTIGNSFGKIERKFDVIQLPIVEEVIQYGYLNSYVEMSCPYEVIAIQNWTFVSITLWLISINTFCKSYLERTSDSTISKTYF